MTRRPRGIFCAAHGGYRNPGAPLGGGAAICEALLEQWRANGTGPIELVSPAILGDGAPSASDIASFGECDYGEFCHRFSDVATARILKRASPGTNVIVNDIAEAPDFAALNRAGLNVTTIFHVDVVAYVAAIYLRGLLSPRTLARTWERVRTVTGPIAPRILRLIFERQRESLLHSNSVIVPSPEMKQILVDAYPRTPSTRIHVVGWGVPPPEQDLADTKPKLEDELDRLRSEYDLEPGSPVVVCLSRISPEKGQDLLLEGLIEMELRGELTIPRLHILICGAPAYMHGQRHLHRLQRLTAQLRGPRVHFPGHVSGVTKHAMFAVSTVYAFPSRHESYGLTLAEALASGAACVALESAGARAVLDSSRGVLVPRGPDAALRFARETVALLGDESRQTELSRRAIGWAREHPFRLAASRVAQIAGLASGRDTEAPGEIHRRPVQPHSRHNDRRDA